MGLLCCSFSHDWSLFLGLKRSLEEDFDLIILPDPTESPPPELDKEGQTSSKKRKRNRTVYSTDQLKQLEDSFKANPYPDKLMRDNLAEELDMSEKKVNVRLTACA